ncbi:MAG: PA2779 family protein [Burkholderiaceae bacterium]|nr:PA2779 family protein [Burkholderiaceae bacterium]
MNATPLLRAVVAGVVVALVATTTPTPVQARVVGTEEALAAAAAADASSGVAGPRHDRASIDALLARDDVRAQLESLGVDPQQARERVQALDDLQVQALADRLEQMPAGGSVLGVVFLVFVILLVTDILGFTRVFPFTRPIR